MTTFYKIKLNEDTRINASNRTSKGLANVQVYGAGPDSNTPGPVLDHLALRQSSYLLTDLNHWFFDNVNMYKSTLDINKFLEANAEIFTIYEQIVINYNNQKATDPNFNYAHYKSTYPAELTSTNIMTLLARELDKRADKQELSSVATGHSIAKDWKLINSYDLVLPDQINDLEKLLTQTDRFNYTTEIYFRLNLSAEKFEDILELVVSFNDSTVGKTEYVFANNDDWTTKRPLMEATWLEYSNRLKSDYHAHLSEVIALAQSTINS